MNDGDVLLEAQSAKFLRVLRADPIRVLLMPMDGEGWPFQRQRKVADQAVELGAWQLVPAPKAYEKPDGSIDVEHSSPAAPAFAEATHERLFSDLDIEQVRTRAGRSGLYRRLKETDTKLAPSTFYRQLRRFLEGGLTIKGLDARWRGGRPRLARDNLEEIALGDAKQTCRDRALKCQGLGPPKPPDHLEFSTTKSDTQRKRAPPVQPTHYVVDRNTLRVFVYYYRKKTSAPTTSLSSLYDDMRDQVFATLNPYGRPERWPLWCIPSLNNFKRYWRELISREQRFRADHGDHAYDTGLRPLAQAISHAFVAGRIGELDATVWNVNLRGDAAGAPLIGPPVVFRIRCRDTGQLLGISVSLESAGWIGAAMAIANCMENKQEFCAKLGLEDVYARLPWLAEGLPAELLADQGETYNHRPRAFIRFTGVSISNLPKARPDLKGGVESDWNVLETRLEEVTPGALIRRYEDETGEKWHIKGNMTLREFTQMLVVIELQRMHEPRAGKSLPEELVNAQVDSSPYSMFQWGATYGGGGLKQVDTVTARLSLLPRMKASVTEWGITARELHFHCSKLVADEALAQARAQGRRKVRIAMDPLLVNSVWLIIGDEDAPKQYIKCPLDMRFANQRSLLDKTWREALRIAFDNNVNTANRRTEINDALAYAKQVQKDLAERAQQETNKERQAVPATHAALKRGMGAARQSEKDQTSPALAVSAPLDQEQGPKPSERPPLYVVRDGTSQPPASTSTGQTHLPSTQQGAQAKPAAPPRRRSFFAEALEEAEREQQ